MSAYPPLFLKRPNESYTRDINFTGRLPTGRTLDSVAISATDSSGADATSTVVAGPSGNISGSRIFYRVQAGSIGETYRLLFAVTLDNGEAIEELIDMKVVEEFA